MPNVCRDWQIWFDVGLSGGRVLNWFSHFNYFFAKKKFEYMHIINFFLFSLEK